MVLSQLTISIRCQLLAMSQRSISLAQAWTWAWRFPFLQFPLECWAGSWLSFLEPLLCCPKSVGGDWVSLPYIELWWQGNRCQLPGCLCCLPACCRGKSFFVCERFNKLHCSHCSLRVSGTLQTSLSWTNPPPPQRTTFAQVVGRSERPSLHGLPLGRLLWVCVWPLACCKTRKSPKASSTNKKFLVILIPMHLASLPFFICVFLP